MSLERFNQIDQSLNGTNRPEDEFETQEVTAVNKRERAFSAEGKFKDLLKLKIILGDMQFTYPSNYGYTREVIQDPKKYSAALGFASYEIDKMEENILEEKLKARIPEFLEAQKKKLTDFIENDLKIVREYSTREGAEALASVEQKLETCKKLVLAGDWDAFEIVGTEIKSYLLGMRDLVELCCGSAVESDTTRATLKVPEVRQ